MTLTITNTYYDKVYQSWMREFCLVYPSGKIDIQLGSKMPARFQGIKATVIRNLQPAHWKA